MSLFLSILCYDWIGFYVVMCGLKIWCGCCSKLYFSFYEKLHFFIGFHKHAGGGVGRGGAGKTRPR